MIKFNNYIQIAGILDESEARMLLQSGIKYIGFPLRLDYHKEDITEEEAARIIKTLRPEIQAVLITYESRAAELKRMIKSLGADLLQIHGEISLKELSKLKKLCPDTTLLKSLVIESNNTLKLKAVIRDFSGMIDAYITDSYDPHTGARGATGKTHDWAISRELVEFSPRPIILAGGLNAQNVEEAILKVKPAGVDVHTGVENTSGRKTKQLVREFIKNAKRAFDKLGEPILP